MRDVAVVVSGNQIHDRAPPLRAASRRFTQSIIQGAVERRWNRGRGRRARSMWANETGAHQGRGGRDSRDVKWHWVNCCGMTRLWHGRRRREVTLAGRRRREWLWLVGGGVSWLWRSAGREVDSGRSGRPPGRSRRDRSPPGRSRRDRRPPGRSRDSRQRLGPRGNRDTRDRESTYSLKDRGREFMWPW